MNVSLTPELERRISEKVESGLYNTAREVVRAGLRLLFEADEAREQQLARFRADIEIGWEQAERGELIDGETFRREFDERLKRRRGEG